MSRVGQNIVLYIRWIYGNFWQGNHQIYGHIRCIYTVLANMNTRPTHTHAHTHAHTHIQTRTHTRMHARTHTHAPTHMHTHTRIHARVRLCCCARHQAKGGVDANKKMLFDETWCIYEFKYVVLPFFQGRWVCPPGCQASSPRAVWTPAPLPKNLSVRWQQLLLPTWK